MSNVVRLICGAPMDSTVPGRGTVALGYEQANRYTVLDQDGATVALLAEDLGGLGRAVGRQLLRTRRSFTATVFSPDGARLSLGHLKPYTIAAATLRRSTQVSPGGARIPPTP